MLLGQQSNITSKLAVAGKLSVINMRSLVNEVFNLLKIFLLDFIKVEVFIQLANKVHHNFFCFLVLYSRQFRLKLCLFLNIQSQAVNREPSLNRFYFFLMLLSLLYGLLHHFRFRLFEIYEKLLKIFHFN